MYLVKDGDLKERERGIKIGYNIYRQINGTLNRTENNHREHWI